MPSSPLSVAQQLDSICDRFESAWKAGQRPSIETQLSQVPPEHRGTLLEALLRLEVELLTRSRQVPNAASYRARFPEYAAVVEAVLREVALPGTVLDAPGSPPAPKAEAPVPKAIGRFQVVKRLGQGAFGQVFLARDPDLDREVAIKVPLGSVLASEPDIDRFLREAQAAGALQHPNVCPVYEIGRHGKHPFIVMPVIKGQSLAALLRSRKGQVPVKQAVGIIRKLALALQVAHDRGIIHRDLKLANVMADDERKDVVIMDFGLARRTAPGDASQTREGTVMGSPAYMSPEQARGDIKNVGPRSDQYSLGVMLYELLTGRLPFQGNVHEVLGNVLHVQPDPPSKHRPGLDPALEAICLQAMAKDPARRFASMRDFAEALGRWLNDAPATSASAPVPAQGSGAAVDTMAQIGKHLETLEERQRSHTEAALQRSSRSLRRTLLLVGIPAALLLAVVALGVGYVAMREPHIENSVTIHLHGIPFLDDNGVVFTLDGKKVPAKKLRNPIEVTVGEHELVIKRGEEVVERRKFFADKKDNNGVVVVPIPEPEGKAGELVKWNAPGVGTGYTQYPRSVVFSPDGRLLMAAGCYRQYGPGEDGWTMRMDLSSPNAEAKVQPMKAAYKVAIDPRNNGESVVVVMEAWVGKLQFWDVSRWKDLHQTSIRKQAYTPLAVQYSPDGRYLLGSWTYAEREASRQTTILESESGKEVAQLEAAPATFAPDSEHVFHPAPDGITLQLVEPKSKKVIREYKGHSAAISALACSRDGKYVAAGTSGAVNAVRVWDVDSGEEVSYLAGHSGAIQAVAISPDNRRVLTAGDTTARLWDIAGSKLLETFPCGNNGTMMDVCFSPGGNRAAGASSDGTVRVWQLPPR